MHTHPNPDALKHALLDLVTRERDGLWSTAELGAPGQVAADERP